MVTKIEDKVFYGCNSLSSISIPNSVTRIGESAFENCSSLTSVTIPNKVTSIGFYAFRYCKGLTTVISLNPTPPDVHSPTFSNYAATLQVPVGSKTAYAESNEWNKFTDIKEIDLTTLGIHEPNYNQQQMSPIYDLNDHRLSALHKGLNIIGNKKKLVK